MDKISTLSKLTVVSLTLLIVHLGLNFLIENSISFIVVFGFHSFYWLTLFLSVLYIKKGLLKDTERVWVDYLSVVSIKFFLFLGFIFGMKWCFEINKIQALVHVFLWFFIYLFVEVKLILDELKGLKA